MVKHKTAQELMAERNPLTRTPVAPIDIYGPPPKTAEEPEQTQEQTAANSETEPVQARPSETPVNESTGDRIRPYSTYLFQSQVKGIKLRAIERELDDKGIVQEAIDEYFKSHPLP